MHETPISDREFSALRRFIYLAAGISLSPAKKSLVVGRLAGRMRHHQLGSYREYLQLLEDDSAAGEAQVAIDLLTTNETYFFREPKHFDRLRELATQARGRGETFRVWSAACSTGEEVYSIAMLLADVLDQRPWEVLGSDISRRVLERAYHGHYPLSCTDKMPPDYLKRFCRRGLGRQEGSLLVDRRLRERVVFRQINLNKALPPIGSFDVIFLRNVMIYFDAETKSQVVSRVLAALRPGGHFFVGHSETLNGIDVPVQLIAPASYRKG